MNLLKKMQRHPALTGIAAVVAGVSIFAGAMHAWGPTDRATFTEQSPAPYVTFNSITNNSNYGDERNFAIVKEATSTSPSDWKDTLTVEPGKEYLVRVYVHNNAAQNLGLVATNTRASVNLPTTTAKSIEINSFISADNANPRQIWDQVTLTSDKNFNLSYVAGSAKYTNNLFPQGVALGEDLFTSPGALLGYEKLDGKIPGCFKYSGYVTFKVKPQFAETADFSMNKQVRKNGITSGGWTENYAGKDGDKVDFVINYKNESQVTMKDVVVKDTLPAGLTYVPGSTVLANGNNPTGKTVSDNVVTATGINIGSYLPGASAWVRFSATVASSDELVCGVNTLKNTATVVTDYGNKSDDATVTVEKKCDTPTPVDKDVTVCEIATKKIVTIKESVYNANKSAYADKDSDLCKEAPVDKDVTVCNIETGVVVTIKESVYNAGKAKYADKDSDKCKSVTVCEISSKTVITISKEQYNAHKDLYADQNSEVCKPVKQPETPEVPKTPDTPVVELPETGFDLSAMSLIGAGALTYAGYAYSVSRRV
jgi:uncharacterized repeat protein (TIGR01451 family)